MQSCLEVWNPRFQLAGGSRDLSTSVPAGRLSRIFLCEVVSRARAHWGFAHSKIGQNPLCTTKQKSHSRQHPSLGAKFLGNSPRQQPKRARHFLNLSSEPTNPKPGRMETPKVRCCQLIATTWLFLLSLCFNFIESYCCTESRPPPPPSTHGRAALATARAGLAQKHTRSLPTYRPCRQQALLFRACSAICTLCLCVGNMCVSRDY